MANVLPKQETWAATDDDGKKTAMMERICDGVVDRR